MRVSSLSLCALLLGAGNVAAFQSATSATVTTTRSTALFYATAEQQKEATRLEQKAALLNLLGRKSPDGAVDPVLADPETKEAIRISSTGTLLGGQPTSTSTKYSIRSSTNTYSGSSGTFINLLEPISKPDESVETNSDEPDTQKFLTNAFNSLQVFIPPPLRSALATAGAPVGEEYVPMRDLFTSPAVSFAYERGWRQGFAQAGFPGADDEYQMARDYFVPATVGKGKTTVVDMSCATGLFTRRLAKSNEYDRVLGCDYSESMLTEARRRINAEPELSPQKLRTRLDLVRLDVGQIPMQTESVDALHAGAAMHCWPDLPAAASEIYRVLKPGGRYFATTFLSSYFGTLQAAEGGQTGPSMQAFQYFESVDQLRNLMEQGGFEHDKIQIEVLGAACVVIRCEK